MKLQDETQLINWQSTCRRRQMP